MGAKIESKTNVYTDARGTKLNYSARWSASLSFTSHLYFMSQDSVVATANRLWVGDLGFESQQGNEISLSEMSRLSLGPTQPYIPSILGVLSLRVNWPGHEVDNSPPTTARGKNEWNYTLLSLYAFTGYTRMLGFFSCECSCHVCG
jgi:hypothetical protein